MAAPMKNICMRRKILVLKCCRDAMVSARLHLNARHLTEKKSAASDDLKGVIGLEIHAQINSKSKLFSGASTSYGGPPNSQVAHFDAALPGTLPVLNRYCVEAAVKTSLAFGCRVNKRSSFDRKHYFYADMPAGYQITQYREPIAVNGEFHYVIYVRGRHRTASKHKARIHQIQLEQDSGKSLHDAENSRSLVDLNRAGVGLLEIVTEPDFETGEQAEAFIREVQSTLKLINICDGRMEQGMLRIDANISVHRPGEALGVRTEVKNLNSLKSVQQAIDYEVKRQKQVIASGEEVINETMSFDASKKVTVAMRDKERLQDYRFMAEPNLPPVVLSQAMSESPHILSIDEIASGLPELRHQIRDRLTGYGLSLEYVAQLMGLGLQPTFDAMLDLSPDLNREEVVLSLFKFHYSNVMQFCGEREIDIEDFINMISVSDLLILWRSLLDGRIIQSSCKQLLHCYLDNPTSLTIQQLVDSGNFSQITDTTRIAEFCNSVLLGNTELLTRYKQVSNKKKKDAVLSEIILLVLQASDRRVTRNDVTQVLTEVLRDEAQDSVSSKS